MKKYVKYILCSIIVVFSLCIFSSCGNNHEKYTINFIDDGKIYNTIETPGKELIELPSDKGKVNHKFDGWFFDKDTWNNKVYAYSFADNYLIGNINVYAHYIQNIISNDSDCAITDYGRFEYDNGNLELVVDSSTTTINLDKELGLSKDCELWVFDKNNNKIDNTLELPYGESNYKIKVVLNEYISKDYSISIERTTKLKCDFLNLNGDIIESKFYDTGASLELPLYQIEKEGYEFIGWGLGNKEETIDESYLIKTNIKLEPKYKLLDYTISYNLDGGTNDQTNPSKFSILDSIDICEPKKTGFSFKGWKVDGLSTVKYVKDFSIDKGTTNDISLTAIWEEKGEYEITYDLQGGVNDILNPDTYSTDNDYITIDKEPTKDGYRFWGWTSELNISPKKNIMFESDYRKNIKLIANWAELFNISYDLEDGTNDDKNVNEFSPVDEDITISSPSRKGYNFAGWIVNGQGAATKNYVISKGTTGDISLKATWTATNYSINYVLNGGENNDKNVSSYNITDSVSLYAPTKEYYTFVGWSSSGEEPVKNYVIPEGSVGDITLYANWTNYKLTIHSKSTIISDRDIFVDNNDGCVLSFESNGGTLIQSQTITSTNKITYPTTIPTKAGYSFTGWYKDSSCTQLFDFSSSITGDTTVYAGWIVMTTSGYNSRTYRNSALINTEGSAVAESTANTSSSNKNFNYFTMLKSGTCYLNYKTSSTGSSNQIYLYIYNQTTGAVIKSNGYISNASYNYSSFTATAGDVICLITYRYNTSYSPTFSFYIPGMSYPASGGSFVDGCILSFDSNGGTSIPSQIITSSNQITYPTTIPTRTGYSFTGWYKDSSCTQLYDFTSNIKTDTTVYAGWMAMLSSSYIQRSYRNSIIINSSITAVSESMANTNSTYFNYDYFTVLKTGSYNIFYKTNYSESGYWVYLYIYNQTTGSVIKSNSYISNTSYNYTSFSASAGDVIYLRTYRYNTSFSPTFSFYIHGMSYPSAGGSFNDGCVLSFDSNGGTSVPSQIINSTNKITYPTTIPTRVGYSFKGWYKDSTCTQLFDFSSNIIGNTTVYAGWIAMTSSNYCLKNYRNSLLINSASNAISESLASTSTTCCNYNYFTVFKTGSYNIYYKTDYSTSNYWICLYIYNQTTGAVIKSDAYISNTSYSYISFTAREGDVIYLKSYRYNINYAPTLSFYVTGMSYPASGGSFVDGCTLSFNSNGGTSIPNQIITKTSKITYPSTIPTKTGYSFTGWYKDSSCTQLFDFSSSIGGNTTVYAGWKAMTSTYYCLRNYRNSVLINSSNNAVSESLTSTNSSNCNYDYFTIFRTGSYNFYYKTNNSTSDYWIYLSIYNQTTGTTIKSNSYISNNSYSYISFTANAGDVIYLKTYRYNSSYYPTFSFYVTGMSYPNDGGLFGKEYTLSFNSNGGTSIPSQVISKTKKITYPTTIPTKTGYSFTGWYKNSACTQLFDFTMSLSCDTTLYAGWKAMETSGCYLRNYRNPFSINSLNNAISESMSSTNSSYCIYDYFTILKTGEYYIYYKTSSFYTYDQIWLYVYNQTTGSILINGCISNTSYSGVNFSASAGDVIYVKTYRYNSGYSPTFSFYVTGMSYPDAGGSILSGEFKRSDHDITAGDNVSLSVTDTANFIGWYANGKLVSTNYTINYVMPEDNVELIAKYSA